MKKNLENFYIIFFIFFIFFIPILSIFEEDKTFSDYENRVLQKLPEISIEKIFDGSFQKKFDTYTSDQIIFKNTFVKAKNYLDILQMKLEINGVYIADDDFYIWRVNTLCHFSVADRGYNNHYAFGVRPVIEIPLTEF